jgi:RNA polymerase sigma-70 factor (ECF subfamily)
MDDSNTDISRVDDVLAEERRDNATDAPSNAEISDAELVRGMRAGDQRSCEAVVRCFGPRMLATARRLLQREQDAQDAVQDAFLSAFHNIDTFAGKAQLGSWLHRIVVNAALMKLRSRRRRKERSIEELLPTYGESGNMSDHVQSWRLTYDKAVEKRETRQLVRDSIAALPATYRSVLLLRDIEQLNTEETAGALDITPSAVRTRLHRARQALKSLLNEHMTELKS